MSVNPLQYLCCCVWARINNNHGDPAELRNGPAEMNLACIARTSSHSSNDYQLETHYDEIQVDSPEDNLQTAQCQTAGQSGQPGQGQVIQDQPGQGQTDQDQNGQGQSGQREIPAQIGQCEPGQGRTVGLQAQRDTAQIQGAAAQDQSIHGLSAHSQSAKGQSAQVSTKPSSRPTTENINRQSISLDSMPWFHSMMNRKEAEAMLTEPKIRENGLYLVRNSLHFPGDHTLSVFNNERVEHYRIERVGNKVTIDKESKFDNIYDLVAHYQGDSDGLVCSLKTPATKSSDECIYSSVELTQAQGDDDNNIQEQDKEEEQLEDGEVGSAAAAAHIITESIYSAEVLQSRLKQHLNTGEVPLVSNRDEFTCPICFCEVEPLKGVVLHECLHAFCRHCLEQQLNSLTTARAGCPFIVGGLETCDADILEREIKALTSDEVYKAYIQRGIDEHRTRTIERVECKTPGCRNWYIIEDQGLREFNCNICGHINCISCEAVHEMDSCEEYKAKLNISRQNDIAQKEINGRIATGQLMYCPGCKSLLERDQGCDYVQCTMCHLEICWITKQRRWGPNGKGDTSAGCKCRSEELGGEKCHPKCGTCH